MADTDSALKTQMFMSESSRQNAMDLTNRISQGFQAASQAVKFESDVSQRMVQSATDFKRTQIDEWYKQQQVLMEAKSLVLREKELQLNTEYRKDQLDARTEYNNLLLEDKQQKQDIIKANSFITNQISLVDQENEALVFEASSIQDKIKALDKDYASDPISNPISKVNALKEEYTSSLSKLEKSITANKFKVSRLMGVKGDVVAGALDLSTVYGMFNNEGNNYNVSPNPNINNDQDLELSVESNPIHPVTGEYLNPKQIEEYNKELRANRVAGQQKSSNTNITFNRDTQTNDYLEQNNARVVNQPVEYKHSTADIFSYANTVSDSDYNPQIMRNLYSALPKEEQEKFSRSVKSLRAEDGAKAAVASFWGEKYEPQKENQRFSDIIPSDDFNKVIIKQKTKEYAAKRLTKEYTAKGLNKNIEDLLTTDPSLIKLEDAQMAAQEVYGLSTGTVEGSDKPTPPGIDLKNAGKSLIDSPLPPDANNEKTTTDYFKLLGVDFDESLLSGENEQRRDEANFLKRYHSLFESTKKHDTKTLIDEMVSSMSPAELNMNLGYASTDIERDMRTAAGKIISKSKEKAIKLLVDSKVRKEYPKAYSMPSSIKRAKEAMTFSPLAK